MKRSDFASGKIRLKKRNLYPSYKKYLLHDGEDSIFDGKRIEMKQYTSEACTTPKKAMDQLFEIIEKDRSIDFNFLFIRTPPEIIASPETFSYRAFSYCGWGSWSDESK